MQRAMINHLKEQVDDFILLTESFEKRQININAVRWPDDKADTKRLKASLSPARRIIARRIGLNLQVYKKWGMPDLSILSYIHDEKNVRHYSRPVSTLSVGALHVV